jgi:site-specific DNA-methyltransferase (adenine-specific)
MTETNKNITKPEHRVQLNDVTKALKQFSDKSVDVIISDPPYNIGKDFGECKDNLALDEYLSWCQEWILEGMRVLKPAGSFYIYGFSEILAHVLANTDAGYKRWLVWHYTNKNSATANIWQRSHESILLLSHQKPQFNRDLVREPYTETFVKNAAGKTRAATKSRFSSGENSTTYNAHPLGALPRDVLKQPALAGGAGAVERAHYCKTCNELVFGKNKKMHSAHELITHPTQKPVELTRRLVAASKNTNGPTNALVLFAGSGAECVAGVAEGCSVVGFDINEDFTKLASLWLNHVNAGGENHALCF